MSVPGTGRRLAAGTRDVLLAVAREVPEQAIRIKGSGMEDRSAVAFGRLSPEGTGSIEALPGPVELKVEAP